MMMNGDYYNKNNNKNKKKKLTIIPILLSINRNLYIFILSRLLTFINLPKLINRFLGIDQKSEQNRMLKIKRS